jgi:hypothetical protein
MFISSKAAHPNAARLRVDYLLSKRGQQMVAKSDLGSLRADVDDGMTLSALGKRLGPAVKPIAVGGGLVAHLQPAKHQAFSRAGTRASARRSNRGARQPLTRPGAITARPNGTRRDSWRARRAHGARIAARGPTLPASALKTFGAERNHHREHVRAQMPRLILERFVNARRHVRGGPKPRLQPSDGGARH